MSKRRKNPPPSTKELLYQQVTGLLVEPTVTPMQVYNLLVMGHRVYKQGMGLPLREAVWKSILDAFRDQGRYYLSPGQLAQLRDEPNPTDDDWATLSV